MSDSFAADGPGVADPEEYNQTARLRAINDARQRVADTIEESMARMVTDAEFSLADRQQVIRATLYSYLTNIEWLMVEAGATDLLQNQHLGDVVIEPPEEFVALVQGDDHSETRVIGEATIRPYRESITGIQGYLAAPEVFEETWTLQLDERHSSPEAKTETKSTHMPIHISKNAFRVANRFLHEAGIDVEITPDRGDAGFDYSDIIDNGAAGESA